VAEVKQFLINRMNLAEVNGIVKNRILLDPGFGFGKSRAHNIALIQHLEEFNEIGQPLLVGLSRKSVLAAITGGDEGSRMFSSIAAAVISAMKGAKIIRVHDVKATVDALKVVAAVQ
jgi:dihydropteroate synthase